MIFMKKALPYILYGIVILGAGGLLIYQGLIAKTLESGNLVKGLLIIAAAVVGMLKSGRRTPAVNKKAAYQKAYAEYIGNAFSDDPKLEKQFYSAVDDYNQNRPAAGVKKLEKLRPQCQRSTELRAVTVFTALCLDDMGLYEQAIAQYDAALRIHPTSSLYSNMGLAYMRLGQLEKAEEAYRNAIRCDEKNAFAWNNLSTLYFRQGDYAQALEYAKSAIAINSQMPQALGCAAVCCALLGSEEEYRSYYRQAVSAGYDGNKIKNTIAALNPEAE